MNSRIKYFVVSTSTCLTLMLLIGSVVGKSADQNDTLKHRVFSDVVAHIKREYVEEPDMKSVTLGAFNGLLESIDPFASYLNADQYKYDEKCRYQQGRTWDSFSQETSVMWPWSARCRARPPIRRGHHR